MLQKVTPMIHVPSVSATIEWYRTIGFNVIETYGQDGGELSFALLRFGTTDVMFNEGGQPSSAQRREVDLYVYANEVDQLYEQLKQNVEIVAEPNDTFYGMREFIVRDPNRFWVTFGEPGAFSSLMQAVRESDLELVQEALKRNGIKQTELTAALMSVAGADDNSSRIRTLLMTSGAVPAPEIDPKYLQRYIGRYESSHEMQIDIDLIEGHLTATSSGQQSLRLIAADDVTFYPASLQGTTIAFVQNGTNIDGLDLKLGSHVVRLDKTN